MSKVFAVVRTIGEDTTSQCLDAVKKIFGDDYEIVDGYVPLEAAAKKTFEIAAEKEKDGFDWVYAVDADVILDQGRYFYEMISSWMKDFYGDRLFCFNGKLNCTKRGLIVGSHFFRTKYAAEVLKHVKDLSFQHKPGREESEMCWWVRDNLSMGTVYFPGDHVFGKHLFKK